MSTKSITIIIVCAAALACTQHLGAQTQLVTNGDFQTGGDLTNSSPAGWNNTIPGTGVGTGQYDPGDSGDYVAYMDAGTQMFQTFAGVKLQPNTTYTVTFKAQVSVGNGPYPAYLFTDIAYGVGSAGTSGFSGNYISPADVRSGSTFNFAPLSTNSQNFTYSFTTKPTITGSTNGYDVAIYMQPSTGFDGVQAAQCFIDNVSVVATPATIVYGGTQTGVPTNYVVQNWSNTNAAKAYDVDGDNRYGSAGYVQFRPWAAPTANIYEPISDVYDLGTNAATAPTLLSVPSYVSGFAQGGTSGHYFVNFDGYSVFTTPDGSGLVRQGGVSLPLTGGGPTPHGSGYWGNAMIFQLSTNKTFRLGVVVDAVGSGGYYSPDYVSVYSVAQNKTFYSAPLVRDGWPDIVFFDIQGTAGDILAVGVWQAPFANPAVSTTVGVSLLTFDNIATEPGNPPVLSYSRSGSNLTLFWPVEVTGYTLEAAGEVNSGTWTNVPGVVNNSVTVNMNGPRSFFRLKKNP